MESWFCSILLLVVQLYQCLTPLQLDDFVRLGFWCGSDKIRMPYPK